ncbi:MAG: hypothetical protein KGL39_16740 [Patescibacteria group bacterium]|nr:hypothetical protein [Patescibacteria group bacterium]
MLNPSQIEEKSAKDIEQEVIDDLTKKKEPVEAAETIEPPETITIEVDGKPVELTKAELAEHYKSGLRQADYTKKTMEAAEVRKAAEAETAKAREERAQYAAKLNDTAMQLRAVLQDQPDWQQLLSADPVEYLKQQHLFNQRQAALSQVMQQQKTVEAQENAEREKAFEDFLSQQRTELLAKLPDWKDPAKESAEKNAIAEYLLKQGFDKKAISGITDHRAVILGRKAMLYDAMMEKANAAAKKVAAAPTRVIKSGEGLQNVPKAKMPKAMTTETAAAFFKDFV